MNPWGRRWVLGMWINYSSCFIPLLSSLNTHHFPNYLSFRHTQACQNTWTKICKLKSGYIQASQLIRYWVYKSSYLKCHVNILALKLRFSVLAEQQHSHFHLPNAWQKYTDAAVWRQSLWTSWLWAGPWKESQAPTAFAGIIRKTKTWLRQVGLAPSWGKDLRIPDHWTLPWPPPSSHLLQFASHYLSFHFQSTTPHL